jgi:hypothetical protein
MMFIGLVAPVTIQAQHLARPVVDTVNHHIPRVMSSGPTAWADTSGWKLVYERTVQPAEGTPGMITNPKEILLLADGQLMVRQTSPEEIVLYDAKGGFIRRLGRYGAGPGEYQSPTMALYHDTLVIHDPALGRMMLLSLDGKEVREFVTNLHHFGPGISVDDRGRVRIQDTRQSVSMFQPQWVHFSVTGARLDSLLPPAALTPMTWQARTTGGVMSMSVPFAPQNSYAFGADGSVIYGGQDRYRLLVSHDGRDTARIFGRTDVQAERIPSHFRDSIIAIYAKREQLKGVMHESDVPSSYPFWDEISIDGRGDVWVARGRISTGTLALDVFDPQGRFLGSVPPPFTSFWRSSWAGDRIAVVDMDENDLPRVRIFRVERRGK